MSVRIQHGEKPGPFSLSDEEAAEIEANAHQYLEAPILLSLDRVGHEHRGKGKGGGQFVSKGKGGGGDSPTASKPVSPSPDSGRTNVSPQNTGKTTDSKPPSDSGRTTDRQPDSPTQSNAAQPAAPQQPAPLPVSPGAVNPQGRDTLEQHSINGQFSPERQKLHQQIIAKHFEGKTPVQNPIAYVLGGGPASGKSSIVNAGHVGVDPNTIHIDSDAIKGMLPEYNDMVKANDHRAASHVHEESSYIAKQIQDKASKSSYNTLLDGTGNSSYESLASKVSKMRAAGQKVVAHYVTVPTELAIQRNIERAKKTGRLPPLEMLRNCHAGVSQIVPKAAENNLFDEFALWDTTNGVVKVASQSPGSSLEIHDQKLWNDFVAKGQR